MAKIMAVDDEPDTIKLIGRILKKAGYDFVGCASGEECLKKLKKEKPDLILLDVMMPGMDGWGTYKRIKEINEEQKVVFLTATTIYPDARKTMVKLDISDYLTKPFEPYELVERVRAALESGVKSK
jgi:DNA-binding response OmpR family regulator